MGHIFYNFVSFSSLGPFVCVTRAQAMAKGQLSRGADGRTDGRPIRAKQLAQFHPFFTENHFLLAFRLD